MIIEINPRHNGSHANQSLTPRIIPAGWVVVPSHLEATVIASCAFCDLTIEDGVLTGITPLPIPEPEPVPPVIDPQEDTDALLVDHELRLTLLELGGI